MLHQVQQDECLHAFLHYKGLVAIFISAMKVEILVVWASSCTDRFAGSTSSVSQHLTGSLWFASKPW
jgi:hypothetical protein